MIELDLTDFTRAARKHIGVDWPKTVTDAFSGIAKKARDAGAKHTSKEFKLKTDWVLKGIRFYPDSNTQKTKAAHALKKYGDMNAAVFLRGSSNPKKSLEFMADHEFGEVRSGKKRYVAIPTKTLKNKAYRTARGGVKQRYRPKHLLKRFNEVSTFDGRTTITKGKRSKRKRLPGSAFIISARGHPFIARSYKRKGYRRLELLYVLRDKAQIKSTWGFVQHVRNRVVQDYVSELQRHAHRLPTYK